MYKSPNDNMNPFLTLINSIGIKLEIFSVDAHVFSHFSTNIIPAINMVTIFTQYVVIIVIF